MLFLILAFTFTSYDMQGYGVLVFESKIHRELNGIENECGRKELATEMYDGIRDIECGLIQCVAFSSYTGHMMSKNIANS